MSKIAGLDWATHPKDRVLVVIDRGPAKPGRIEAIDRAPDLGMLFGRTDLDVIGVDIPFAWPREFCSFVGSWSVSASAGRPPPAPAAFRYRVTDQVVRRETGQTPLAVSADRFAMGARAWAATVSEYDLFNRIEVSGTSGTPRQRAIIEVYPSATARALFGASLGRFKALPDARRTLVMRVLERFAIEASASDVARLTGAGKCSDECDALLAAVTAMSYQDGVVRTPETDEEQTAAKLEGWIFFTKT